jgi:hypothetical protein
LIAGPILPPAGGISIHIYRLEQLLKDEFDFTFIDESPSFKKNIFNIRSLNFIRYIKLVMASDLFFIHSGNKYFKKLMRKSREISALIFPGMKRYTVTCWN